MNINPMAGPNAFTQTAQVQKPEAAELNVGGDQDGDSDNGSTTRITVNASGQQLGQILNTQA